MKKSLMVCCLIILLVLPGLSLRARALKTKFLVTESPLGKLYPEIVKYSMVVSPDGQHFAYVAVGRNEKYVVVDGVAGKHCAVVDEACGQHTAPRHHVQRGIVCETAVGGQGSRAGQT